MNAKELRAAAEVAVMQWDNHDRHRLVAGDDVLLNSHGEPNEVTFARHILSTVRDDDDEPVSEEWFRRHTGGFVNIDGPTIHHCGRYVTWFSWGIGIYDNDTGAVNLGVMDRGQFRSLCRGLGIELKEVSRAE